MEAKRERKQSTQEKATAAAASAAVISLVLGDEDLLAEIFLRLACPSSLVRAALVCKRWLRAASDPAFLRRFRGLHPPRLLGFYLSIKSLSRDWHAEFVPMPPQPTELAVGRRRSSWASDDSVPTRIMDCRNGSLITGLYKGDCLFQGAHSPLRPGRGVFLFPPLPIVPLEPDVLGLFREILSKEDGDGISYLYFTLDYYGKQNKATAHVYMFEAGAWHIHTSATIQVPKLAGYWLQPPNIVLADNKIYIGITMHKILVLDLASSTFFTVGFPDGLADDDRNIVLSPAHGSGIYLVHLNKLQLQFWLHRGKDDKDRMGDWLLIDVICLRNMCSSLRMSSSTTEHGRYIRNVSIEVVGDNAEFVFLQIYGWLVHLDVKSRAWQKVYEMPVKDTYVCYIHPCMMIWPPFFPALEE
jgi:hypothetical protein